MTRRFTSIPGLVFRFMGLIMACVFIALVAWLLYLLYFAQGWEEEMLKGHTRTLPTGADQATIDARREQFHMDIPYSLDTMEHPPVCIACHTAYPHREDVRMRAYLNAHGTHLACEVCHHRPEADEAIQYRWIDDSTDQIVSTVEGSRGVYGARVYPMQVDADGRLRRMGKRINEPEWIALAARAQGLTLEQQRIVSAPAHDELQGAPLDCSECHSPNGMFDFAGLGHDAGMVERLENLEVVQMLEDTTEFHFPDIRGTLNP